MRNLIYSSLAFLICLPALAERQIYEHMEDGAEVAKLRLDGSGRQLLYARLCDNCELLSLSVDTRTIYFDGKRPINATTAAKFVDRGATVFFNPKTRLVTRIVYWPANESAQ